MILRLYCRSSLVQYPIDVGLKGQSNEIFDLHFFHNSNLPGPLTNRLKYFQTAISELPRWNFTICSGSKYSSLNSEYIVSFSGCEFARISKNPINYKLYFTPELSSKLRYKGWTGLTATVKLYTAHACKMSHTWFGGQEPQLKPHKFLINLLH